MESPIEPRSISVSGTELAFIEQGDGDVLVLVHGSLGDYRSWLEQLPLFADRYRTVVYSRRAHYPTAWPVDYTACDPEVHATDLAALIEALDAGPVHLFGHSYGGLTSLLLASRRPELVRTLSLGEPPLMPLLDATPEGQAVLATFMENTWAPARHAFQQGDRETGVRLFLDGVLAEGAFDHIPPPVLAQVLDNAAEMAVELETPAETFFSTLNRDDLRRLPMPVLLVGGEFSPALFPLILDELAACLPGAERAMIPGVSHDLYNPPAIHETLLGFLTKH